ncbi:hypothetical protein [Natronococcus wangiae]|uniref:hypothetical protein n=1 Tax=Natronococcus wangiae TaxID=3068275 RepID=UPI00273D2D60|nr:hypothetical protein [Natronococcus sp. AD5]
MSTERPADPSTWSVRRRLVLGGIGSLLSLGALGTLGYATRSPAETLEVRVWFSERAARYDGVDDRVLEYLDALLDYDYWRLELSRGGVVRTSTEDGARVTTGGEWPAAVAAGALGARDLEPAADVNLLVTDGQLTTAPTGFAIPHVASVGGAQYLAALPPFDDLETTRDDGSIHRIVENERPTRAIQILLHELGHALGLEHDHGVAFRDGDAVVATPMLSSYAWDPDYDTGDRSRCGAVYARTEGRDQVLSLTFSACAQREFEEYSGGLAL